MDKKYVFLLLGLVGSLIVVVEAAPEDPFGRGFHRWSKEHGKVYSSDEYQYRFQVWKSNSMWIREFTMRNNGSSSFTVAMNQFGDLTNDEFNRIFKGLIWPRHDSDGMPEDDYELGQDEEIVEEDVSALPTSVDWRQKGVVTGIKNQQQCGSCWAFSTTGSLEGAHALQTGKLVSLSEQNLVDCSSAEGNEGCNGGLMDWAFEYIIRNKGIDTEASYPYHATDGTCTYKQGNCGSTLQKYVDVTKGSETALQTAVAAQGPVSVAIDASHLSFQFYSSGVYYEPACSPTQLDHGVLAVGYDTSGTQDYWIVKNSWGTSWGMKGYIWMSRNRNNNCGIATASSYPVSAGATAC